jgi:hypothetical protein
MDPLNLRRSAPRGPREMLAGIVFTARLVDKLRASLPGGELNGYLPAVGFSELWAHYTKIDLNELRDVVSRAVSERDVEVWIDERTGGIDKELINGKMERFESGRMAAEYRDLFEQIYPADLRGRHARVFDLLEADDARLYAGESG